MQRNAFSMLIPIAHLLSLGACSPADEADGQ
jgi:hypothetical protein